MAIHGLPQDTVRAIGASQVLTDPAAVVKELIDNALDAFATSVAVEISVNTLDVIQVRDNGRSIPPEDRPLVARRYCTSKINCEDDLRKVGGSSLGFRGEALASMAEMSGSLTISARIDGEHVATVLKISQAGELVGQEHASLPVGTTVRATDFIRANPVRRQVALKQSEQTLKKIKRTLQAYAFARPTVRLALKVLKHNSDKVNWIYAPKPNGNVEDAALKIVGSACASQCTSSIVDHAGITMQAFLPRADAETEKVNGFGSFISCDGRPVSSARGTFKQMVRIYREILRKSNSRFSEIKEPFIFLDVRCPAESYDANVEPAKDDVLFQDPESILETVRRLFAAVYASAEKLDNATKSSAQEQEFQYPISETHEDERSSIEMLLPTPFPSSNVELRQSPVPSRIVDVGRTPNATATIPKQRFRYNMYGCDEEDLNLLGSAYPTWDDEAQSEELRQSGKDVTLSNPWVMAKLNTRLVEPAMPPTQRKTSPTSHDQGQAAFPTPMQTQVKAGDDTILLDEGLPTPRPSSPTGQKQSFDPSDHVPDMRLARDGRLIGLQTRLPFQVSAPDILRVNDRRSEFASSPIHSQDQLAYSYDAPTQPSPSVGTPLDAIPEQRPSARRRLHKQQPRAPTNVNKPFVSPMIDGSQREKVWFDHLEGIEGRSRRTKKPRQSGNSTGLVAQGDACELAVTPHPLSPPARNRDIREFVNASDGPPGGYVPLSLARMDRQGRPTDPKDWNSVVSTREEQYEDVGLAQTISGRGATPSIATSALKTHAEKVLNKDEVATSKRRRADPPRALRQISGNANLADENEDCPAGPVSRKVSRRKSSSKLNRSKSSRLPLESIPTGKRVHDLVRTVRIPLEDVVYSARKLDAVESSVLWNKGAADRQSAFRGANDLQYVEEVSSKVYELLINRVSDREMVQDLGQLISEAFRAHQVSL